MVILIVLGIMVVLVIIFIIFLIIKKFLKPKGVRRSLFGGTPGYFVKAFFEGSGLFSFIKSRHLREKLQEFEAEKKREEIIKREQQEGLFRIGKGVAETNDKLGKKLAERNDKLTKEVRKEIKHGEKSIKKKSKKELRGGRGRKSGIGKSGNKLIIKITNFEQLLRMVNDKKVAEVLQYLKKKDYIFIKKRILNRNFESEKEFNQFLREEVVNFLRGWYDDLRRRISDLRKGGKDIGGIGLKLMFIPLKIRLFEASFYKEDFDKVVKMLEKMQENLENYEVEYAEKEKSKEEEKQEKREGPEPKKESSEEAKEVPKTEEKAEEKQKQAKPEVKKAKEVKAVKVKKAVKKPKAKK